jgi:flagellar FliJ protein
MKKFSFSLDKVLRHRHIQADLAKKDFVDAQNNLNDEVAKLANMKDLKEAALDQRRQTVQQTQSWSATVEQINIYLAGQDVRIKNQTERLTEFENIVESRRQILQEALTAAKIIEKLREKKKEEFMKEVANYEQQEMDELSVMRFAGREKV